jgi:hypothetical protein
MLSSDAANIIFSARRRIGCATQDAFAHLKTVSCDACLRTIHWWNRRVRLVDSQLVHLSCWKGQLFFKALVADHIRYVQVMAHDSSASSRNHLHENELRKPHASATQHERVERPVILLQLVDEVAATTAVDKTQRDGKSFSRELGEGLQHFLARLAPHRPPRPPQLCMLCGAVESNQKLRFCSKCSTPLRPSG